MIEYNKNIDGGVSSDPDEVKSEEDADGEPY